MYKFLITLLIVFSMATMSFTQVKDQSLQNAAKNYLHGLSYSNRGLVESTIDNILILKLHYPEMNFDKIIKKLDSLSIESPVETIRLKAFLASNYLKYPKENDWIKEENLKMVVESINFISKQVELQKGKITLEE